MWAQRGTHGQPHNLEPTCPPHGGGSPNLLPLPCLRRLGCQLSVRCFSSLLWWSPTSPRCNWPREGSAIPVTSVQLLLPPCTQEGSGATCVSQGIYRAGWGHGTSRGIVPGSHTTSPPGDPHRGTEGCSRGWEQLPELGTPGHPCATQAACDHRHAGGGLCFSFPAGNCCAAAEVGDSTHVLGLGVQPGLGW